MKKEMRSRIGSALAVLTMCFGLGMMGCAGLGLTKLPPRVEAPAVALQPTTGPDAATLTPEQVKELLAAFNAATQRLGEVIAALAELDAAKSSGDAALLLAGGGGLTGIAAIAFQVIEKLRRSYLTSEVNWQSEQVEKMREMLLAHGLRVPGAPMASVPTATPTT